MQFSLRHWQDRFADLWANVLAAMARPRAPATAPVRVEPPPAPAAAQARASAPADVFTPTRPRSGRRTLAGRRAELARILESICDDTAHVVLYAERGRGKTSLSNLAIEGLRRRGVIVARYVCEAESNFDTIMRGLAADLPASLLAANPDGGSGAGCEQLLPDRPLRPTDIAAIPRDLTCPKIAFVVDEFDRVTDLPTRTRLADTIKLVSDRGIPLSFMIVGVSSTLEEIIGQHVSIQRNIAAIHLPLLEDQEVASMIERGGQQSGIEFPPEAVAMVVGVARGMPYMAQLLGLRIAQAALVRRHAKVASEDLLTAVQRLLDETASGVIAQYNLLTEEGRDAEMAAALLRLVEAEQDRWGRIRISSDGGEVILGGRRLSSALWLRLRNSSLLTQCGSEPGMLQFADRAMIYYVQLLAAKTRVLGERRAGLPDGDPLSGLRHYSFVREA
jgi:hypothetical protein